MTSPFTFFDESGTERLTGRARGGGAPPVQANYAGGAVTIADGANGQVPWETLNSGTELLDRTDPANPLFLASGWYFVQVSVQPTTLFSAGGTALVAMSVGGANADAMIVNAGANPGAAGPSVIQSAQAADAILLLVANADGVLPRDFLLGSATVVRFA